MATKAEIAAEARMYLDEMTAGRLVDSPEDQYGLFNAIDTAYIEFTKLTRCFPSGKKSHAATTGTATYAYTTFDSDGRLFIITQAGYDDAHIDIRSMAWMDANHENWRYTASGTCKVLIPDGDSSFTLWPAPGSAATIDVWGYLTPDGTLTDYEEPAIQTAYHSALAARAAVLCAIRFAGMPEAQAQGTACHQMWLDAIAKATQDFHEPLNDWAAAPTKAG